MNQKAKPRNTEKEYKIGMDFAHPTTSGEGKKKPEDWLKTKAFRKYTILDPDGWDRQNFDVSWNEPITKDEMMKRVMFSTIQIKKL